MNLQKTKQVQEPFMLYLRTARKQLFYLSNWIAILITYEDYKLILTFFKTLTKVGQEFVAKYVLCTTYHVINFLELRIPRFLFIYALIFMVWLDPRIFKLNLLVSSHPTRHAICQKLTLETNINVELPKEQK